MDSQDDPSTAQDDRYHEAVASYLRAVDAGSNPDREQWLERYADVATRLQAFFVVQDRISAALNAPNKDSSPQSESVSKCQTLPYMTESEPEPALSKYEILAKLGRGGMGVVYRARHRMLDKQVAVKFCLPGKDIERFQREAKLLSSVRSPYIVAVHDFDLLPDGRAMLVMDWVEGRDLGKLLRENNGPFPESRVVVWMLQVCQGMQAAANQNIVHRDLKPSNILLDLQDQAHVADFGLARSAGVDQLSVSGGLMGTPHYMAPEQAEDPRGVDTRADIYSFGATFYHALTGKAPFEGPTAFAVLYKHKTEPLVSPRVRCPTLSERMSELLERCLAKSPVDRFPSFTELLKHLQPTLGASSPWLISDDSELAAYQERYYARKLSYLREKQLWNKDLDIYTFPRGQTLRIMRGDLEAQKVDVLVSSDTCYLNMDAGVAAAIRQAGGPDIMNQAMTQRPVRPGRAAVTSAGNLPARFVFHGVTVGYVEGEFIGPSRDLIVEIMTSCIYHADSYDVRSIAFPLLATGGQGFPRPVCLDTMFQFLARLFLRGLTSVREARIVIYKDQGFFT